MDVKKAGKAQSGSKRNVHRLQTYFLTIFIVVICTGIYGNYLFSKILPSNKGSSDDGYTSIKNQPTRSFCRKDVPTFVCAHGGYTENGPPNTKKAFEGAISLGVDCVEIDVALTRDRRLVVLHERELRHLLRLRDSAAAKATEGPASSRTRNNSPVLVGRPHSKGRRLSGVNGLEFLPSPGADGSGIFVAKVLGEDRISTAQVGDFPLDELLALRWESGDGVLQVEEAVRLTMQDALITLDLKTYNSKDGYPLDSKEMAEAVVKMLYATKCVSCLVWAKSDSLVKLLKTLSPGQRVGHIAMNCTAESLALGMDEPLRISETEVVGMHYDMIDAEIAARIQGTGKLLYSWTVNNGRALERVLAAGVDAVVTNRPIETQETIDQWLTKC